MPSGFRRGRIKIGGKHNYFAAEGIWPKDPPKAPASQDAEEPSEVANLSPTSDKVRDHEPKVPDQVHDQTFTDKFPKQGQCVGPESRVLIIITLASLCVAFVCALSSYSSASSYRKLLEKIVNASLR